MILNQLINNTACRQPHHESLEGLSLPGSKESCLVTVVNRKEPAKRSRVLLNLRTRQIWEEVLRDMGESIGMRKASRLLTPWGEEKSKVLEGKQQTSMDRNRRRRDLQNLQNDKSSVKNNLLRISIQEIPGDSSERGDNRREGRSHLLFAS
ncbi:echinoderm microtubule-associated protein-like protein [Nephila pilipes]|uniref:Echinoderm microtubule-associated protein-like protein n=1 Tax=Nephila pilipes TaxID=299642 RepID=A0A8X6T4Y7_NEPPI|nr:echinoderm microtubule-associated protein-like protein [Nephila pilipes]